MNKYEKLGLPVANHKQTKEPKSKHPAYKVFKASDLSYNDVTASSQEPWYSFASYVIDSLSDCLSGDYDDCGVCDGNNQDLDCNGDCYGSAEIDDCGMCAGGNTGEVANEDQDCTGECFGNAVTNGKK